MLKSLIQKPNDSKTEYTFYYTLFDEKDKNYIEEYMKWIGREICQ